MRLIAVFLLTVFTMAVAYAFGFATAGRMPQSVWQTPGAAPLARVVSRLSAPVATPTPDAVAIDSTDQAGAFEIFWRALERVQSSYYGADAKPQELTYGALRGSLQALEDPFTVFTDPEVTQITKVELEGEFEGIGAYVSQNDQGQLVIQTPMRGQPAEKAGILAGDIVLKVDGKDITGMDSNDAVLLIRGPKGTTVTLTIKREGEPGLLEIPVVRDRIEIPSVAEARVLTDEGAPDVGYLQITSFSEDTKQELDKAIDEVRGDGAKALIVDLRNNPGGYLDTAIEVTSEFIGSGVVVQQEDSRGNRRPEPARGDGRAVDLPLVLLINKGSASASEIVAGAIRDYKRGVLVGETSYGKGSVQNVHSLSDDSQLRVTVAAWLTPKGSHIHKKGVEPDVKVERTMDDLKNQRDPQLDRAIIEARRLLTGGQP